MIQYKAQEPSEVQLKNHVIAYQNARYYHNTKLENVDSIMKTGLDPKLGGSNTGLTANSYKDPNSSERQIVQNHVYLTNDKETSFSYLRKLGGTLITPKATELRVFLTPDEVKNLDDDKATSDGYAVKTQDGFLPRALVYGTFNRENQNQLTEIFSIVRMHYPKNPEPPNVTTIIEWHFIAIRKGLLNWDPDKHGKLNIPRPRADSM